MALGGAQHTRLHRQIGQIQAEPHGIDQVEKDCSRLAAFPAGESAGKARSGGSVGFTPSFDTGEPWLSVTRPQRRVLLYSMRVLAKLQ